MILYPLTVFLGAFLLFLVQPLIAKQILPLFGGSAGVWTTCQFFFQAILLFGYGYSHVLARRLSAGRQLGLHVLLLCASLGFLPILATASWRPSGAEQPLFRILGLLVSTVGLPYLLTTTTSPLLQAWYARMSDEPYRLFALSNLASLLALISYPLLFEPLLTVKQQAWTWSGLYVVFVLLSAATGWYSLRHIRTRSAGEAPAAAPALANPPALAERLSWLGLSALGSILLLTFTSHMTQNISSVPLLWIVPLVLYLASFILCFDSRGWYVRWIYLLLGGVGMAVLGLVMVHPTYAFKTWILLPLLAGNLFIGCMVCHGELSLKRPHASYLTHYYLMISLGGALGALLISVVAPLLLPIDCEIYFALVAVAGLGLRRVYDLRWWRVAASGLVLFFAIKSVELIILTVKRSRVVARNFYGALRVFDEKTPDYEKRVLMHGVIRHGEQLLDEPRRRLPLSYYDAESGGGLALRGPHPGPRKIGVIGLGAGTLATYGQKGDVIRFYEINPLVVDLAYREFTFLRDTSAQVEVILGDARLNLEREASQRFDVLVVDAFSGDSIPVHLITREALALYLRHMKPEGVIAFHLSNLHLKLTQVVADLALDAGLPWLQVIDQPHLRNDKTHYVSEWVLLTLSPQVLAQREADRLSQAAAPRAGNGIAKRRLWTDDYHNLLTVLR